MGKEQIQQTGTGKLTDLLFPEADTTYVAVGRAVNTYSQTHTHTAAAS
jgi:hypothetical protein